MLSVTNQAVEVIRGLTAQAEVPDQGGIRISAADAATTGDGQEPALQVSVVAEPAQDDQVLSGEDVQIFLDPPAADFLDDKVLDAGQDEQGQLRFTIAEVGSE